MSFDPTQNPHRRYNALTGDWVLVSPHRTQRPWQGQREAISKETRPVYDPSCYLCPGNERAGGAHNPQYTETFVFTNDYAALLPDSPPVEPSPFLMQTDPVKGECRVICFSPRHDLTLPQMTSEQIEKVVDIWADQITDLGSKYTWVQVFENKGAAMGCSNPHPHGQVWAGSFLPHLVTKEDENQKAYLAEGKGNGAPLLLEYLEMEKADGTRIVESNEHWTMLVPFWAVWPFEYLLLPHRHVLRLPDLTREERASLADILRVSLIRYDNLFETSFPYSMGWHGAPTDNGDYQHWQLHAHFYPPLLRSATVRKFMVGYEMMAEAQRDLTAEQAAQRLRDVSTVHYLAE